MKHGSLGMGFFVSNHSPSHFLVLYLKNFSIICVYFYFDVGHARVT